MSKINDAELMRKLMLFQRKARSRMTGHGPGFHPQMQPGLHSGGHRTDGCFHPGRDAGQFPQQGMGSGPCMEPGPGMGPRPGMGPGFPPAGGGPGMMRRPPLSREFLLRLIGEQPDGIRQKEVAQKAGINQSSASELINKLESTGYIERKVDPADKRATLLFLTEKGTARAAEIEDERAEAFQNVFSALTEEEKETLSGLLDKLLDN
ncbi:MAG: MarR family transcriptional regulator [Parasporobacterium sp.]|nr:MarR family transcriptional regulator [Parasporobacterium sp.]